MKLQKIFLLQVLALCFLLSGCIGDDQSDCLPQKNFSLEFSYLDFAKHIQTVTVGIYDANGLMVRTAHAGKQELGMYQGMFFSLPAGSYTVVCWGNASDNTRITGFEPGAHISSLRVAPPGYFSGGPIQNYDNLYYGIHRFTISNNTTLTEHVNFSPAYIRFIVRVRGLSSLGAGMPVSGYPYLRVNNVAAAYDYQMVSQGDLLTYHPKSSVDVQEKSSQSDFYVLRFGQVNPVTIEVIENSLTNAVLHKVNLQSFIASQGIIIEPGREVTIPIDINFNQGLEVIVSLIRDWEENPVIPQPQE